MQQLCTLIYRMLNNIIYSSLNPRLEKNKRILLSEKTSSNFRKKLLQNVVNLPISVILFTSEFLATYADCKNKSGHSFAHLRLAQAHPLYLSDYDESYHIFTVNILPSFPTVHIGGRNMGPMENLNTSYIILKYISTKKIYFNPENFHLYICIYVFVHMDMLGKLAASS